MFCPSCSKTVDASGCPHMVDPNVRRCGICDRLCDRKLERCDWCGSALGKKRSPA